MLVRLLACASLTCLVGCSSPPAGSDGGAHDSGNNDNNNNDMDGGDGGGDGGNDGGSQACTGPADAGAAASVDLFSVEGSLNSTTVYLLTPFTTVAQTPVVHQYDNRCNDGLGCYADHYNTASNAPPSDADIGTITMSGYHGGTYYTPSFTPVTAPSSIDCAVSNGIYQCPYHGKTFADSAGAYTSDPLGTGAITFAAPSNAVVGTFSFTDTPSGSLTSSSDLSSLTFSASSDLTLNYACTSSACTSSNLIIVSFAATQNDASHLSASSPTIGSVTCAQQGGTSITIPKEAIAAMLDGDTALKSVVATIVNTHSASANSGKVQALVGKGVFGVSSL